MQLRACSDSGTTPGPGFGRLAELGVTLLDLLLEERDRFQAQRRTGDDRLPLAGVEAAKLGEIAIHGVLLQVDRHHDVQEVVAADEQARAIRAAEFEANLVALHRLEAFDQELRVEADLDVAAIELAGEVDLGLAGVGAAAGELQRPRW